jgi:hypothetical protein
MVAEKSMKNENRPKPPGFTMRTYFNIHSISSYDFGVIQAVRDYIYLFYYGDT